MSHTKDNIIHLVRDNGIKFIRMQFTDVFGQLKNVTITDNQLEKALDNQLMFDGSSIEGFTRINESDQYLHPDLDSFSIFPWQSEEGKIARLICDIYQPDGAPFLGAPRGVLRRALNKAKDMGFTAFNIGPECEFFLFKMDEYGKPTTSTNDEAGYFDLGPLDQGEKVRRNICLALEQMKFDVEASHHEVAAGQHEIDFKYSDALDSADKIMTFKLAVKIMAQKAGLHATFMPKPLFGKAGSGMHINMSLFKGEKNMFYDENDKRGLSKEAYSFMAGILKHIDGITAITNPLVNSYKRLVPGYEAPCYIAWSTVNRSALIRIPAARGNSTRIELRSPDSACNPYLALAVCLAAGLDGIEKGLVPPQEITKDIFAMSREEHRTYGIKELPSSLAEALSALEADDFLCNVLGTHIMRSYITGKRKEWYEYCTRVSSWEIDRYLVNY